MPFFDKSLLTPIPEGYKIYGQEQVIRDDFNFGNYFISEEKYKTLENYKINSGDILISLVGTFGKISIVPNNIHTGIINPRLMKLTLNTELIDPIFFKFLLSTNSILSKIQNESHGGTLGIINVGIIKKLKIPLPPIQLQIQFAQIVEQLNYTKSKMQESLREMNNQFNALLQKAFR